VTQQTNTITFTTPSDRELVTQRTFDAPRQLVFDAWTKPEHLVRWFGGEQGVLAVCEVDLRPGGKTHFVWQLREGGEMGISGEFREIDPPSRIVYTEIFDEPYREQMGGECVNTLILEERDGKTLVTITTVYNSREARDGAIATGMEEGMIETFGRLDELLKTLVG
jgi:uncharacterized protein YndB with AHSA1/START domain